MSNVSAMKLASSKGSIEWNNPVNAAEQDFDNNILIGFGFVSVNTSALDSSINASANVSVLVRSCNSWVIYHATEPVTSLSELKSIGRVVGTGSGATGSCTTYCSNPRCSGNTLTFTVEHFEAGGGDGNPGSVPEFTDYAILFILITVISGFLLIRKKEFKE